MMRRTPIASLGLGAAFVTTFLGFAWRARFLAPYADDWDLLAALQDTAPLTRSLWRLHNEHLILVPRLLVWLDFWLWGWPGWALFIVGLASHAAVAAVLIDCARQRHTRFIGRLLSGTVLVLVFLTYQLQGVVFPGSVMLPLVTACASLAFWTLCRAPSDGMLPLWRHVVLSAVFAVAAMLSLTNGLAVPFVLALVSGAIGLSSRVTIVFLLLGLAGAWLRYAVGGMPSPSFTMVPSRVAAFGLAFLGGPLASVSVPLAVTVGGVSVLGALWALWTIWQERRDGFPVSRSNATLAAILLFGLIAAGMIAPSRAQLGLGNAAQSRYVILVSAYWAAVMLLAVPRSVGTFGRRSLAVVLPALALLALPLQVLVGIVWVAKADHLATASLALATGVWDDEWVSRIHPLGERSIRPLIGPLAARGVAFLLFPERDTFSDVTALVRPCDGHVLALDPTFGGQGSTGLRIQGFVRDRGAALLVSDRSGLIRGKAAAAPLVPFGRASANDFVRLAIDQITRRGDPVEPSWLGFSARGAGPPYIAELRDTHGGLVCQVQMACCTATSTAAY